MLLNNDTAVDPGWLAAVAAAERYPAAGMLTPKILNYWPRDEIDNTGHLICPDGLARGRGRLERDDGRFDHEGEALWPSGCAGVQRELLDDVGRLVESFFAYAEDVDLGLRAQWWEWECWYVPAAVVYHKYSATVGAYSPRWPARRRSWGSDAPGPGDSPRPSFAGCWPASASALPRRRPRSKFAGSLAVGQGPGEGEGERSPSP